jgi:glycosidase
MQWGGSHADGFTTGTPWEALQPDSLTTTVAAEDADPQSLLNLNRRLIHLRSSVPVLGRGRLLPLTASDDGVAAYLRRDGDRAAMVVVNLTSAPVSGVTVTSDTGALPAGEWRLRSLLDSAGAPGLVVRRDGRVDNYAPTAVLGPYQGRVFELVKAR